MKLALGSAQFGLNYGINNKKGKVPKEEVFKILEHASKKEIDTIDTASGYGDSEEIIGEFIQKNSHKCHNLRIISKLSSDEEGEAESLFKESLKKLNSGKVYGYLIHDFQQFLEKPEIWSILKKLKQENKAEKIGFSLYYPKEAEYILENNIDIDIIQSPYSVFDQRFSKIFSLLKEKGVEIHVRSVFLQGLVFKKPDELTGNFIDIKNKILSLHSISEEIDIPLNALCLNFAILNENIDKVIVGVDSLENLQQNTESLKHKNRVKKRYQKLLELKEENENIILPTNWNK